MRYDPDKHHRRSIRLRGYDYAWPGAYFVTIVTQGRECLFGDVVGDAMQLNKAGHAVLEVWGGLPDRFPAVQLDAFVVMPNHVHAIVIIVGAGIAPPRVPDREGAAPRDKGEGAASRGDHEGAASSAPTLGDVMRAFKSLSALSVNRLVGRSGQPLWQRNYFEHVVRDEADLDRARRYIEANPQRWAEDEENPAKAPSL